MRKINREKQLEQYEQERRSIELTEEDLAHVIEVWTGIPASNITENEFKRIDRLESQLLERIIGQDEAVSAVVRAIKRSRAGVQYKRKPVSFIFAGPTGVSKPSWSKRWHPFFRHARFAYQADMSEYMENTRFRAYSAPRPIRRL